jgi:ATP-dependent RNA helicase DeaD
MMIKSAAMSDLTFPQLGLSDSLVATLTDLGYEAPTPIQTRTIPALLGGKDLIGQAQTGTGKTAAFALPILQKLDAAKKETQALILAPTRELAMQVAEAVHTYARGMSITVLPVYGGAPIGLQMKHLQRGAQIVVGTPGRLIDHLDRKTLRLDSVKMIVLDEADEMLKMGFLDEVERILSEVPAPRQVALFSATMPDEIARIARKHLVDAIRVEIEQRFLNLSEGQKLEVLTQLLELEPNEAVLIFRRTKTGAAELAEKLEARGFAAVAMHGDMTQPLREGVIRRLRNGQIEIVVATDVAARGLDVEQISHVVNYDVPNDVEAYVHRIGRTGRAGRSGVATMFITPRERRMMREIERFTGIPIKPMKMPTSADVAARRISIFKQSLRKNVEEGDLDLYVELVQQLADEGPFDMADIAAAASRLANASRSLVAEPEAPAVTIPSAPPRRTTTRTTARPPSRPEERDVPSYRYAAPKPSGEEGAPPAARAGARPRSGKDTPYRSTEPKVRLTMAVGKNDGIRPADIVGSIANEADVPGRDIGPIDIRDDITIVVIPEKYRDQVLKKVAGKKFRGAPLNVQVADGTEGPRAPFHHDGPSPSRDFAPRPPYQKRSAPRTDSAPRSRSAAPRSAPGRPRTESAPPYAGSSRGATGARPRAAGASSEARKPFYSRVTRDGPRGGKPAAGSKRPFQGRTGPKKPR